MSVRVARVVCKVTLPNHNHTLITRVPLALLFCPPPQSLSHTNLGTFVLLRAHCYGSARDVASGGRQQEGRAS